MPTGIYKRNIRSKKYPIHFRVKALTLYKRGQTFTEISKTLGASVSIVHYWIKQLEPTVLTNGKYWLGKKRGTFSLETRIKMGESRRGSKSVNWIKDRTKLKTQGDRRSYAYSNWRKEVWKRDNFTCRIKNNDCKGRIEAHHILGYAEYPELRYQINNGITVCHFHHPRKVVDEKKLIPTFRELVLSTIK